MDNASSVLPRLRFPVVVEGRYDKAAVLSVFSGTVITTDGFGIFNSAQKRALIRRLGENGIILLTDPDAGGKQIRSFISGILPKDKIYQVYAPRKEGKEKRKRAPSREGVLGVEGVGADEIRRILMPFAAGEGEVCATPVSAALLYSLGLTGGEGSAARRDAVCEQLKLPGGMNAKAFASAVALVSSEDELRRLMQDIQNAVN